MNDTQRLLKAVGLHPEVIRPLGNLLIVQLFKPEATTQGGLHLPDSVVEKDFQVLARVISVGTGQRSPYTGEYLGTFCAPGDLIVVLKHKPVEIRIGGELFHTVFEGDVVGVVDEDMLQPFLDEIEEAEAVEAEAAGESIDLGDGRTVNIQQTESGLIVAQGVNG